MGEIISIDEKDNLVVAENSLIHTAEIGPDIQEITINTEITAARYPHPQNKIKNTKLAAKHATKAMFIKVIEQDGFQLPEMWKKQAKLIDLLCLM